MSTMSLHDLLDEAAARCPNHIAVRDSRQEWTYAKLRDRSHAFARWLLATGVQAGDRVVVHHDNNVELVAMLYGTSRARAVFVPISKESKPFQLNRILADSTPAVVIGASTDPEHVDSTTAVVRALGDLWREIGDTPGADVVAAPATPDAPVLLMYTSGSTSLPKGVVCPQDNVLFAVDAVAERLGYHESDRVFLRLPLSFDYGLYQIFLCAKAGATLHLGPNDSTATLLREIEASGATVVPVVPALALMLCQLAERKGAPSGPRLFTNTGAALSSAAASRLRASFPGSSVISMFGLTECKRASIGEPDGDLVRPGSVGTALRGTTITIVGDDGMSLPPGRVGQIVVSGKNVMAGYFRAPELTAQRFGFDEQCGVRLLRTGDFGWLDEQGNLYFDSRKDDVFKRRGTRTSCTEIEAAALDVDGVESAFVQPLQGSEERLYVVVTGDVEPERVLKELAVRLERAKQPDRCLVLDAFPLTTTGKTDKTSLRATVLAAEGITSE